MRRIDATAARAAVDGLAFAFRVEGDLSRLRLPETKVPHHRDDLWQHSCFEAFLRADGSDAYYEFNFSPSGAWAAYRFSSRRTGRSVPEMAPPQIELRRGADVLAMTVRISLEELPELKNAVMISSGVAAVMEDNEGRLSYWALAHGAAQPDFHDPRTFMLRIPGK